MRKPDIEKVKHHLELEEDVELHKTGWVIQRIGWIILALFVIAAAVGFFGSGIASSQKLQAGANSIKYERYSRYESHTILKLHLDIQGNSATLEIPQTYLENMKLEKITPEPMEQFAKGDNYIFIFSANQPFQVLVYLTPKKIGKVVAPIKMNSSTLKVSQFIYP